jgi:hypothetical protein
MPYTYDDSILISIDVVAGPSSLLLQTEIFYGILIQPDCMQMETKISMSVYRPLPAKRSTPVSEIGTP